MSEDHAVDVRTLINTHQITPFQWMVVFFCFLVVALVGFELAIMGYIAPEFKRQWQVTDHSLGPVLSAAMVGLTVGALFAGPLADKFGRRLILVVTVLLFGLFTLVCATADNLTHMVAYRFITGLGLGGAMPNAAALVSEFSPEKRRSIIVTFVFAGFTFGAAGSGFLSALLIPFWGWRSVLLCGGVLSILMSLALLLKLPESIRFLMAKDTPAAMIRQSIRQLAPDLVLREKTSFYFSRTMTGEGDTIKSDTGGINLVLSARYRFGSFMFWITFFMGCALVYLFSSWMPTLVKESGYTVSRAAVVAAFFQIAGPVGSLFIGWCMDRTGPEKVLACSYVVGGIFLLGFSMAAHHFSSLLVVSFIVGFCFNGANAGMTALTTLFYPTSARATGASWMHGIGHLGAILSTFAGAEMLAMNWSFAQIIDSLTLPALLAALAVAAIGHRQLIENPA